VFVEQKIRQVLKPLGRTIIFTKESYKREHGGKSPEDDGLKAEQLDTKCSGSFTCYKKFVGLTDVWELVTEEELLTIYHRSLDEGVVVQDTQHDCLLCCCDVALARAM
jgi:hypothetical protein